MLATINDYERLHDGTWKLKTPQLSSSQVLKPNYLYSEKLSKTPDFKANSGVKSFSQRFTQDKELSKTPLKIITANDLTEQNPNGVMQLWGSFLYEKSIQLLAGEAGVGKTTLAYNLAIHGAKGEDLCNIPFKKPLNIFYCDLETGAGLRKSKAMLISDDIIPDNLYFIPDLDFMYQLGELIDQVKERKIDLIIVDTINEAFNTRDEQDNAEANRQFKAIKRLRDEGDCSILLMHQPVKESKQSLCIALEGLQRGLGLRMW